MTPESVVEQCCQTWTEINELLLELILPFMFSEYVAALSSAYS